MHCLFCRAGLSDSEYECSICGWVDFNKRMRLLAKLTTFTLNDIALGSASLREARKVEQLELPLSD